MKCGPLSKASWPELAHKLPPKRSRVNPVRRPVRCIKGKLRAKESPECRGFQLPNKGETLEGPKVSLDLRYYHKAQIRQGAEPNATGWVGADGEAGDFKGLTLSNSGPVFFLGSRGFSSGKARSRGLSICTVECAGTALMTISPTPH